jgi:Recombinase zinc beta ribbon domain
MRPYGYTTNQRTECIDDELEKGRAAAAQFLDQDGTTLRGLVSEWNVRGYKTVTGRDWTEPTMRRMFLNPANAGLLPDGRPAPWPAMFDPETHRRLKEKFSDPDRRTGGDLEGRAYLLTGDDRAVCALCGKSLISHPARPDVRSYVCSTGNRTQGCGKVRVQADGLERYVATHVLARISADMDGPGTILRAHQKLRDDAVRAVAQARNAQEAATTMAGEFAAGNASKEAYLQVAAHSSRLADEARVLARLAAVELPVTIDDIAQWWNSADLDEQRVLLDLFVEKVYVGSAKARGSRVFDESRVSIAWR